MFQFLDKQSMGYTAILGLRTDLRLVGQSYSWASSIFYFGYLAASYPVARLLVRFPVGKTLAASVFAWALVLMCMAACTNAAGLMATRFFLGFCEAAVAPGFSVVTSMWYKRGEQPLRHGAWFMGNVAAGLFGSVLAYSMAHIDGGGVAAWQAVFLIFGAFTLAWSVSLFWTIPDKPTSAWFLKGDGDGRKAVLRVKGNMTGIRSTEWKGEQVWEALKDPQSWLFVLIQLCGNIPNGGVSAVSFLLRVAEGAGLLTRNSLRLSSSRASGLPRTRLSLLAWLPRPFRSSTCSWLLAAPPSSRTAALPG